jgi:hypothetical protein
MELLSLTLVYWFVSIGLITGFVLGLIIGREGVSLGANIFFGVLGALIMGFIGIWVGLGDGVWFSFVALIPFLFLINVFHQHHQEDIIDNIEEPTHVI